MSAMAMAHLVPTRAHAVEPLPGAEHFVGHVERQHGDGRAALEHDVRRLGVDVHVELRRRGDIAALEISARHHHDAADPRRDVGRLHQGQREIGRGRQGNDMHFSRLRGAKRLHDEFHSMLLLRLGRGRGQFVTIEAGRPVNMVGNHQLFQNRSRTSGEDGNIRAPGKLQDLERC